MADYFPHSSLDQDQKHCFLGVPLMKRRIPMADLIIRRVAAGDGSLVQMGHECAVTV